MDGDDVGLPEQRVLVDERRANGAGDLAGEILAPGDHRHAEGERDPGNLLADIAQPDHAEALAPQVSPMLVCQPPSRTEAASRARSRALARMRAQECSMVGVDS